ncbi:MAG: YdcF family protein [Alphaproteobacteria bacterium]|nr:YdcF family protein [Alphaproteobacteria bacterium]
MAFALSKILWFLSAPGSFLTLLFGAGLFLSGKQKPRLKKIGQRLVLFVFAVFLVLTLLPIGTWLLTPLENRFAAVHPPHVDGIIVLGGDEQAALSQKRQQPIALDSVRRYVMFARLAKQYPSAKLVFSGGSGKLFAKKGISESSVARDFFSDLGLDPSRIAFEKESRNTYENAMFSAKQIKPKASETWLLVTSAWHMPRAMACFRKADWPVSAAPTGFFTSGDYSLLPDVNFLKQLHHLTMALHEYVGLVAYWLMGRTSTVWPSETS